MICRWHPKDCKNERSYEAKVKIDTYKYLLSLYNLQVDKWSFFLSFLYI